MELQHDIVGASPQIDVARKGRMAIVAVDRLRVTDLGANPSQCLVHIFPTAGEARVSDLLSKAIG